MIRRVRSQLKESAAQLAVEKQRNSDLVGEHFKLSQQLRRVVDQADLEAYKRRLKEKAAGVAVRPRSAARPATAARRPGQPAPLRF